MSQSKIRLLGHIMVWSAFVLFTLFFMPFYDIKLKEKPLLFGGMFFFLISYYYFNEMFLVPSLLKQKRIFEFILITLAILALYLFLAEVSNWLKPPLRTDEVPFLDFPKEEVGRKPDQHITWPKPGIHPMHQPDGSLFRLILNPRLLQQYLSSTLIFLLIFIVSTGTSTINYWTEVEKQKSIIEQEKAKAELLALKSQINPHFLFNTLNNIYHLSMQKSDETAEAILQLSYLMRFVTNETQFEIIPLSKEIEVINQYIYLQKLRLTDKTKVNFLVSGNTNYSIEPLLLLPIVENAFKYGVSAHLQTTIEIEITINNDTLYFSTKNAIIKNKSNDNTTKLGLLNLQKRLQIAYDGKHQIKISESNNEYNLNLKLLLT